jgi:hypothetical protein
MLDYVLFLWERTLESFPIQWVVAGVVSSFDCKPKQQITIHLQRLCGWLFLYPELIELRLFGKNLAVDLFNRHVANGGIHHAAITPRAPLSVERRACIAQFIEFLIDLSNGFRQASRDLLVQDEAVAFFLWVLTRQQQFAIVECKLAGSVEVDAMERSDPHDALATSAALGPTKQPTGSTVGGDLEPEIAPVANCSRLARFEGVCNLCRVELAGQHGGPAARRDHIA